jgi:hypothetical protein
MRDGCPLSWRHFVHGLNHLARDHARTTIRDHFAVGMTQAKTQDRNRWLGIKKAEAGWS